MAVEIREIIIRTEITSGRNSSVAENNVVELNGLKRSILDECKKMIADNSKKSHINKR